MAFPAVRLIVAAALAAGLLLTGCSNDPAPIPSPPPAASGSASASGTPSASPTPTSTLTPDEQRAVDEATGVILAYRQLLKNLLADPDPRLNDLNDLVTGRQLEIDLNYTSRLIRAGETVMKSTGPVTIASVESLRINLEAARPTVTLLVCVDSSAVSGIYQGKPFTGGRNEMRYRVVKTTYLPDPGWAVARLMPAPGGDGSRPC